MNPLPSRLYTCEKVKELDRITIESHGVPGFELMSLAGKRAFGLIKEYWPEAKDLTVFCGAGNNGGDGYIVASIAAKEGMNVSILTLVDTKTLSGDAKLAYELARRSNVKINAYQAEYYELRGIVVDALLGIGIVGEVRSNYAAAINEINASCLPVLAIDIPSGVCGDTGIINGVAVKADATVSFIGLKQGLLTGRATNHVGDLHYESLDVSSELFEEVSPSSERLQFSPPLLQPRETNSHKGLYGHALIIGGDSGFGGAGILAAESSLLSGAGLVSLATRAEHVSPALTRTPELMVRGVRAREDLLPLIEQASVLIVGPGMGLSGWSHELFEECLKATLPMVIDADGLRLLASMFDDLPPRNNWVLTPHPGEAAMLLNTTSADVQSNRFESARAIQQHFGGVTVLKGAGTIVADESTLSVCAAGNPAMSTPGMGDILSGIIGGLLAQGNSVSTAAKMGVWAHATAGDMAAGEMGKHLLATDIYPQLRSLW